ncbi:MAG: hypothetical protein RL240_870, partial [Planctomycetota bacterium]
MQPGEGGEASCVAGGGLGRFLWVGIRDNLGLAYS